MAALKLEEREEISREIAAGRSVRRIARGLKRSPSTMARGAEACAAMVARADLRLAEAAVPDRPRHADISRSDLSQSLCSDARRAEEGADGTVAYKAADASRQRRQGQEWTGAHTRYGLYPR